jgi:hypothetical protein
VLFPTWSISPDNVINCSELKNKDDQKNSAINRSESFELDTDSLKKS